MQTTRRGGTHRPDIPIRDTFGPVLGEDPLNANIPQSVELQRRILGLRQPNRRHRKTPTHECATIATWSGTL
jgi:hypothetical protein